LGEASVNCTPASLKTKYGAAPSSNQKPVLRPVSPSWSWDVNTIKIFMFRSFSFAVQVSDRIGLGHHTTGPGAGQLDDSIATTFRHYFQ
jgi:hypothetical protein